MKKFVFVRVVCWYTYIIATKYDENVMKLGQIEKIFLRNDDGKLK